MGGVDATSTAGIGENHVRARKWACEGLEFMGVKIDDARNEAARGEAKISADDSRVQVWGDPDERGARHRARYAGNRYEKITLQMAGNRI